MKPLLQLALDVESKDVAIDLVKKVLPYVDIVEAGTVLVLSQGIKIVQELKEIAREKLVLADIRIIKAGGKLSDIAYKNGADIVTIISDASKDTIDAVVLMSKKYKKSILVEVNKQINKDDLLYFRNHGIEQIIFHRSNEVVEQEEKWSVEILNQIDFIAKQGFKVFVTGGVSVDEISLFKDIDVYCFIIGRSITNSVNPDVMANLYRTEINKVFG